MNPLFEHFNQESENHPENNKPDLCTELYNTYHKTIYNLAYRMTGNASDAEDIAQETFLQAFRHIAEFRGESKPSTWLYAIAKNACLKHLQKRAPSSFSDLENLVHSTASIKEIAAFDAAEKNFYIEQVKEGCLLGLLRCLPLHQRIGFIVQVLLEVETAEVAMILEKSENATRILIHRARQSIKGFLCRNCSGYDAANPCRCEYLIHFSLNKGWITEYPGRSQPKSHLSTRLYPPTIEKELHELKKLARLYRSLPDHSPDAGFVQKMKAAIRSGEFLVFSSQKVK